MTRVEFNYKGVILELDVELTNGRNIAPDFMLDGVYHKGEDITEIVDTMAIEDRFNEVQRAEFMEAVRG